MCDAESGGRAVMMVSIAAVPWLPQCLQTNVTLKKSFKSLVRRRLWRLIVVMGLLQFGHVILIVNLLLFIVL